MRFTGVGALCTALMAGLCACGDGSGGGSGGGGGGGGDSDPTTATASSSTTSTTTSAASSGAGDGTGGVDGPGGAGGVDAAGVDAAGGCGGDGGAGGADGVGGAGDASGTGGTSSTGGGLPDTWTCDPSRFGEGLSCDCACGAYDPDCDDPDLCVEGCGIAGESRPYCESDGTCRFVPGSWTCDDVEYHDGDCDCGCGADDLGCLFDATSDDCDAGSICEDDACVVPAPNDECATASALVEGTTSGTWHGANDDLSPGSWDNPCTNAPALARDVVYRVTLEAGQTLTVTVTPAAGDPSIYLTPQCGVAKTCVAGADAGGDGAPETLVYTAAIGGEYFLVVDQYGLSVGATFTLEVSIHP